MTPINGVTQTLAGWAPSCCMYGILDVFCNTEPCMVDISMGEARGAELAGMGWG